MTVQDIPPELAQQHLWNLRRRTRARSSLRAIDSLVTTPHDLGSGPLRMPAGARLAISHSVGLTAGEVTVSLGNGASFSHPALVADVLFPGLWAEKGQDVTVSGAPTGTLTLHVLDPFSNVPLAVATRVVA